MKKIIFISIILFLGSFSLHAQSMLDYSNYHLIFDEEFTYPDITSSTSYATSGSTSGTPFNHNWTPCIPANTSFQYLLSQISQPATGGLRFTENYQPDGLYFDECSTAVYCHVRSAGITSNFQFGFGIIEAKIRIVSDPDTPHTANTAFWSQHHPGPTGVPGVDGNEIDILDGSENNFIQVRNIDWNVPDTVLNLNSTVTYCDNSKEYDSGLHVFSILWTPTYIQYYIDSIFKFEIDYENVRIYPDSMAFSLVLGESNEKEGTREVNGTADGETMDIQWVKCYRPKCTMGDFDITPSDIHYPTMIYPYLPGYLKQQTIEVEVPASAGMYPYVSPACVHGPTDMFYGAGVTLLEGEAVTILPDFLANEWGAYTLTVNNTETFCNPDSTRPITQIENGYFEILPIRGGCDSDNSSIYNHNAFKEQHSKKADSSNKGTAFDVSTFPIKLNALPAQATAATQSTTNSVTVNNNIVPVRLYPNPALDNITITALPSLPGQMQIVIRDITSKAVYTENVPCYAGVPVEHSISLSSFIPGVYLVDVTTPDQHIVKKVVKL